LTGLVGTDNGLLVFKDSSIHLWDWPDSAAPHEVSKGASIEKNIDNVGGVGNQSILQNGNEIFFIGKSSGNNYGVYIYSNGEITRISSDKIDTELARINTSSGHKPMVSMVGNYIFLIYDNGDTYSRIRFAYDAELGCWVEFTSPEVTCTTKGIQQDEILMGTTNGRMVVWPSTKYEDVDFESTGNEVAIPFMVRSAFIDAGYPDRDKKFRASWASVKTDNAIDIFHNMLYNDESTLLHEPIMSVPTGYPSTPTVPSYEYGFWEDSVSHLVPGWNESTLSTNERAKGAVVEICGNATNALSIFSLQCGWRERTDK
jgi:hypothetical protein